MSNLQVAKRFLTILINSLKLQAEDERIRLNAE